MCGVVDTGQLVQMANEARIEPYHHGGETALSLALYKLIHTVPDTNPVVISVEEEDIFHYTDALREAFHLGGKELIRQIARELIEERKIAG